MGRYGREDLMLWREEELSLTPWGWGWWGGKKEMDRPPAYEPSSSAGGSGYDIAWFSKATTDLG